MRTAGQRAAAAGVVAAGAAFCAVFFANGTDVSRLVWIGALALLLAAFAVVRRAASLDRWGAAFLACLLGLVVWTGASTAWSISPDRSWQATNRVLVYAAFAVAGLWLGTRPATAARAAAWLLAALYGWALLAKSVPPLFPDYARIARLRAPLGYWNELGLLGAAGVPVALWLRGRLGAVLLFAATLVTLLTYSRVGIALAVLAAVAWTLLDDDDRVGSLGTIALGGGAGIALFGVALALPGLTSDGEPDHVRWRDGLIFAALVLVAAGVVALGAAWLGSRQLDRGRRRSIELWAGRSAVAAVLVAVVLAGVFSQRLWHSFANPVSAQIGSGSAHVESFNSSNRWRWWQEEWSAFTEHPLLGTGAATFHFTDLRLRESSLVTSDEPHNTPLQQLGELGLPGFLLYLGAIAAAVAGIVAARRRAGAEAAAVTALGLALGVFALHTVVDMDWSFLATCGPAALVAGILLSRREPAEAPARRPLLLAAAAVLVALGGIYSLAAPWLSQRTLASATTIAGIERAHSYDPLATPPLLEWATLEDANGNTLRAAQLYRDATSLEPESSETWLELGTFYYDHRDWQRAYDALDKAWHYDKYGPAGTACGILDQARHKAIGVWPSTCPRGSRPGGSP